jgi:nitronate monooxygenase
VCIRRKVPIIISSLPAPNEIMPAVHANGGIVLHHIMSLYAERPAEPAPLRP